MPAPAFLKSGPAVTSFGIFGTGAVGVGGWQVVEFVEYENSWPVAMAIKFPGDKPQISKLGLTDKTYTVGGFSKKYDCFNGFFAEAQFSHEWWFIGETGHQQVKSIDPENSNLNVNPPSFLGKKEPQGCALMQLSQSLNQKDPYWSLKAEIAVKNEKIGWALWILGEGYVEKDGEGVGLQYSQRLHYRLALLEWYSGKWNVRTGYFWADVDSLHTFDIKVIVPGNETWINKYATTDGESIPNFDAFSTGSGPALKEFSGKWVASEEGKEIFEEMATSSSNDSTYTKGILGNKGGFSNSEIDAISSYLPNEDKWVDFDKDNGQTKRFEPKKVLDAWYAPFKGKTGTWTKFN